MTFSSVSFVLGDEGFEVGVPILISTNRAHLTLIGSDGPMCSLVTRPAAARLLAAALIKAAELAEAADEAAEPGY